MLDRYVMAIDGTALLVTALVGRQVRNDLVTVEVEVDPFRSAASFGATQQVAIEGARLGDVPHRKCKMEWDALSGFGHGVVVGLKLESLNFKNQNA